MSERDRRELKGNIHWLAKNLETEEAVLKPIVKQVTELAQSIIENRQQGRLPKQVQAEALMAWKEARKRTPAIPKAVPLALLVMVLFLPGCRSQSTPLVESAVVGDDEVTLITVAWPDGISEDPEDFVTRRMSNGVMVTAAPLVSIDDNAD